MKGLKNIVLPLFLLVLFTTYRVNLTMFFHVHNINGITITHSHPGSGEHTHSKAELLSIVHHSHFSSLSPVSFVADVYVPLLINQLESFIYTDYYPVLITYSPGLRAPPLFTV